MNSSIVCIYVFIIKKFYVRLIYLTFIATLFLSDFYIALITCPKAPFPNMVSNL